ncbi:unnamed protein product [Caretta caretta]
MVHLPVLEGERTERQRRRERECMCGKTRDPYAFCLPRFSLPVQHLSSGRAPSPAKRTPPTLNNEESISKIKVMTDAWDLNPLANGKPLERTSKESLDVPSGPRDTADDASRRTVADDDKG